MMTAHAYFNIDISHVFNKSVRRIAVSTFRGPLKVRAHYKTLHIHNTLHTIDRIAVELLQEY